MITLAIVSQKGGVGKTTTAAAVGTGLAMRGRRVLLIDVDPQCNLSYMLGVKASDSGSLGIMRRPEATKDEIIRMGDYDVIPAAPMLAAADKIEGMGREYRLRDALATVSGDYDYAVIDAPPSLGLSTINALVAADFAIVPASADPFSLSGLGQLSNTISAVRKQANSKLRVLGVVLTRYNDRTIIRRTLGGMIESVAAQLGTTLFSARIRETTSVIEAAATRQSLFRYAPRATATRDYNQLIDEILERIHGSQKL